LAKNKTEVTLSGLDFEAPCSHIQTSQKRLSLRLYCTCLWLCFRVI